MLLLKKINEDLKAIKDISLLTSIYQEVAQMKMREIRSSVLENRIFLEEILKIYRKARMAFLAMFEKGKKGVEKFLPVLKKREETVVVFLSANQPFYGPLILNIWQNCFFFLEKNKADLVVVGRIGKYLAESSGFGHKLFYFEMSDEKPEPKAIKEIVDFIKEYRRVIVFHGKYQTVARQEIAKSEISTQPFVYGKEKVKLYLFEPSPKEILEFFETEIFSALFNQTILEHQLAKFSSRMVAMYRATENARKMERMLEIKKRKLEKDLKNKEQINLFGSSQLW
ncbi:MAG: F0F1 ATP synthase subunit gamma [Minisyncoccales bacterium]